MKKPARAPKALSCLLAGAVAGLAGLAAPRAEAVQLALSADDFGCFNVVDLDAQQIQMLPTCALVALAGNVFFPDVQATWPDGDRIGAVVRDFFLGDLFVADFASLADQDLATGLLVGARGPDLVFAAGLGGSPEVRDAAVLPDGTVLLLVEDQGLGRFWICELDTTTGAVAPLASIDPAINSSFEGGLAHLGGDEVLVTLFAAGFDPAFFAVDLDGGAVEELAVRIPAGQDVASPTALTRGADGTFLYTHFGSVWTVLVEPAAGSGRRARFTVERVAGRNEWYQPAQIEPQLVLLGPGGLPDGCVADGETLCLLGGRFEVGVEWEDFTGNTGHGQAIQTTSDSGEFWFFSPSNVEMVVKVLNGCGINGNVWLFAAATTTVEFALRVEDTVTGNVKTYFNPLGTPAVTRTDTEAFPSGCTAMRVDPEAPHASRVRDLLRLKAAARAD